MLKTLRLLSVAALLSSGAAVAMAAGNDTGSRGTTGTMTGSQQTPSTGSTTQGSPGSVNRGGAGVSAQSTGPIYPGVVGPTGSRQPDATNPARSMPSGGGGQESGSGQGGARGRTGR
jgi:hypothetical protein